jgi:hypothetical protein
MNSLAATTPHSPARTTGAPAPDISTLRRNLLRPCYALMAVGLAATVWPDVIAHTDAVAARSGVSLSLLAGLGATAALGIRYPVRMLPVLIFELVWKTIFLTAFALPLYLAHRLDTVTAANAGACLIAVRFIPVIPWRHVVSTYLTNRSEKWK